MSETTVVAVVTIVLVVIPLVWALSGWFGRRSHRAVLRGLGLAIVPIGLVLTGLMRLLVRAIRLVVDWFAGTVMTTTIWIGIIVIVAGLVMWFVAGFMTPVTREMGRERRRQRAERSKASRTPKDATRTKQATRTASGTSERTEPANPVSASPAPVTTRTDHGTPSATTSRTDHGSSAVQRHETASPRPTADDRAEDAEVEKILRDRGIN